MNKYLSQLLLCLLLLSMNAFGQSKEKAYPIDINLNKCIELNGSTVGIVDCTGKAEREWDAELNKYYQLLLKELDSSGQQKLRESQRAWLSFKEKEIKLVRSIYDGNEGTVWNVIIANRMVDITRQRAKELIEYYDTLMQH